MDDIKQRVSYLKGMAEGMGIKDDTDERKLLNAILGVLEQIADELDNISSRQDEMDEYLDIIDEDLAEVEDIIYDYDEDDDEDEDRDDTNYIEIECPHCHEVVYIDTDVFEDEEDDVLCPNCHQPIYEYEDDDEEDDDSEKSEE